MSTDSKHTSPYHRRLQLVLATINENEKKLGDEAAMNLAVKVLHALDHIPERIR